MNYKEDKEIADLIKSIGDLNQQIKNPDSNIRQVLANAQKAIGINESLAHEQAGAILNHTNITTLDKIDVNVVYRKLPEYKSLCEAKLLDKVGKELYNEIKRIEYL